MKSKVRKLQFWLHRHYDGVKLSLAITTLFVLVGGIFAQNQILLRQSENTQIAVKETQATTEQLELFTRSVANAVDELKDDNKRQTVILCTIILRGNLDLSQQDADAVREICEREVERALTTSTQTVSPEEVPSESSQSVNPSPVITQEQTPQLIPPIIQPQPESQPESDVCQVLSLPVLNIVKGLLC